MKGLVAYDSYYGNTANVAAAIAEELHTAGHDVRLVDLHHERVDVGGLAVDHDFLVLGGPTRMKHISGPCQERGQQVALSGRGRGVAGVAGRSRPGRGP